MFLHEYLVFKVVSLAFGEGAAALLADLRGGECLRIPRGSIKLREIQCGGIQTGRWCLGDEPRNRCHIQG